MTALLRNESKFDRQEPSMGAQYKPKELAAGEAVFSRSTVQNQSVHLKIAT
jgi:hypothetical protein